MDYFTGVIENRFDPLQLGRVKVRIHGCHTADKKLIPTEDLPWAHVVQNITSAAMQGIGHSPTGIVEGTHVVGFFADGESQQVPLIIGTLAGYTNRTKTGRGFEDPTGIYPKDDLPNSDINELARNSGKEFEEFLLPSPLNPTTEDDSITSLLESIKQVESGGDPNATNPNSTAKGLYQFTVPTWESLVKKYGNEYRFTNTDINNSDKQEIAARLLTKDNYDTVKNIIGRNPTGGELYLAHFSGASTASTAILVNSSTPNAPASEVWSEEALTANESIFYNDDGSLKTVGEVYSLLTSKVDENKPGTIVQEKKSNVNNYVPVGLRDTYDVPPTPHAAQYPYNHVYRSESGHIQEFDDTPNKERIHQYHKAGTFYEIHPDGSKVTKVVGKNYHITASDDYILVEGNSSLTVKGDMKIYCEQNVELSVEGNVNTKASGNVCVSASKEALIASKGRLTLYSEDELVFDAKQIHLNTEGKVNPNDICPELFVTALDEALLPDEPTTPVTLSEDALKQAELRSGSAAPSNQVEEDNTLPPSGKSITITSCDDIDETASDINFGNGFSLSDFTTSASFPHQIVAQQGLTKKELICNLKTLSDNVLVPIISEYGRGNIRITSGFRPGQSSSQHEKGQAVDIQFPRKTVEEVYAISKWVRDNVPFDQFILEYGSNPWFHLSFDGSLRNQVLTRVAANTYKNGLILLG